MTKIERDRRIECLEADCPVFEDCAVKWGNKCARLYGDRDGATGEGVHPVCHPMQRDFESAVEG